MTRRLHPHPLLRSPHLQTLWGPLLRRTRPPARREERLPLRDGDHLWLTWAGPTPAPGQARILILHGLAGSADSHYVIGLQRRLTQLGLSSVVMNARGTGRRPNDLARSYHAGEIEDLDEVLAHLRRLDPTGAVPVVGYSLGGSRVLNWLARRAPDGVPAAVAVSVPLQLAACGQRMEQGFSRLYRRHLIQELVAQLQRKQQHLERVRPEEAARLQALGPLTGLHSFRDFDHRIVAPLHGFEGAEDYYQRASAGPQLPRIRTPTLLIQAQDDPFMPSGSHPTPDQTGDAVILDLQPHGGHVGFVGSRHGLPRYWLEHRIVWFLRHCGMTLPAQDALPST